MLDRIKRHRAWNNEPVHLRVGINTGPVVAGVIGQQKFIYDLWGDVVNTASRMESNGLVDGIQVTEAVKRKLDGKYTFEQREPIDIKGKGQMVTYLLRR
jgi:class 3 adenylate cyclase